MQPDIKYFPNNWVPGMLISSQDFISQENAVQEEIRDARAVQLHAYNYGLLPSNHPEADNYPRLVYDYVQNVLVLKECRALTPSGQRIEITEANHERNKFPAQLPSFPVSPLEPGRFDVYLHVDTFERVGAGDFARNNPPRQLAVSPKYELSVRAQDGTVMEQENFLKISELEVREGRVEILTRMGTYIPPCTSIQAFATLVRMHGDGEQRLNGLVQHYHKLVDRLGKEAPNKAALKAMDLAEKLVTPIISSLSYYRHVLPHRPPVYTLVYFKDYARLVGFLLNRPFGVEVIEEFKPNLLEVTARLDRTEPRHAAMQPAFDQIKDLLEELNKFLSELSKYNYNKQDFDLVIHNQLGPMDRRTPEPEKVESPPEKTVVTPLEPVEPALNDRPY